MRSNLASLLVLVASAAPAQDFKPVEKFDFAAETLGGRAIDQTQFKDSVLIVDLWGTWCPPCRKAIPSLVEIYRKYKHHGLEIVGLNYNEGEGDEALNKIRKFAIANQITYPLALGPKDVVDSVPGFEGFPTMLFFERGLKHTKTKVGFEDGDEKGIEEWVRKALGLDPDRELTEEEKEQRKKEKAKAEAEREKAEEAAIKVPEGRVFKPSNGDKGFAFELPDEAGKTIRFADFAGKPVLVAVTTSWDAEAIPTAKLLQELDKTVGAEGSVVALSIEQARDPEARKVALTAFRKANGISYTTIPTGLKLVRGKVHRMSALPTWLIFDGEGTLVFRAEGRSDDTVAALRKRLAEW